MNVSRTIRCLEQYMFIAPQPTVLSDAHVLEDDQAHDVRREVGMLFRLAIATFVGEVYVAVLVFFLS
jgi:hypothetical protein